MLALVQAIAKHGPLSLDLKGANKVIVLVFVHEQALDSDADLHKKAFEHRIPNK